MSRDANDIHREEGEAGVRALHDQAHKFNGYNNRTRYCITDEPPIAVSLDDFYAYMPMHNYIYTPSRDMWPGASINARISPLDDGFDAKGKPKTISAATWLDRNKPIEQMTWAPGLPMIINDRLVSEGGWIPRAGVKCFNLYRAPRIEPGDPAGAGPWLDHVRTVYPDDADHIIRWLAHRVQRPQDKINHALVLGGRQGIGKDTLLEPVKYAVGSWNFVEVGSQQLLGRFNGFLRSVILRVSEARDLGDVNRYQFYEHLKSYTAAPPDVLRVDEKYLREYSILNCTGVIITTNHKSDGIYLPEDDRRHFVAWSGLDNGELNPGYWDRIWSYYAGGGLRHVAAYLARLDISAFGAKAPPPRTAAFYDIVSASRAPEDAELADILDSLGNPPATTLEQIITQAGNSFRDDFAAWLKDRKNRRAISHRFEACEYVPVRNPDHKQGLWRINDKQQVVYAKRFLSFAEQIALARRLTA